METTCRTENICKLLRSKEGAAITTGAEGRLFQGRVVLCPFPRVSRMFSFPWACCLSFLPLFFFFFLILLQEHSLGTSPTWTSLVKEMRVERLRGRGTVYVINLCMALNSQKSPLVICSCLLSEPGLLREGSDKAGLLLKAILINQRQSQEKQEGVHQDECKVQLSKYGMGV